MKRAPEMNARIILNKSTEPSGILGKLMELPVNDKLHRRTSRQRPNRLYQNVTSLMLRQRPHETDPKNSRSAPVRPARNTLCVNAVWKINGARPLKAVALKHLRHDARRDNHPIDLIDLGSHVGRAIGDRTYAICALSRGQQMMMDGPRADRQQCLRDISNALRQV